MDIDCNYSIIELIIGITILWKSRSLLAWVIMKQNFMSLSGKRSKIESSERLEIISSRSILCFSHFMSAWNSSSTTFSVHLVQILSSRGTFFGFLFLPSSISKQWEEMRNLASCVLSSWDPKTRSLRDFCPDLSATWLTHYAE